MLILPAFQSFIILQVCIRKQTFIKINRE